MEEQESSKDAFLQVFLDTAVNNKEVYPKDGVDAWARDDDTFKNAFLQRAYLRYITFAAIDPKLTSRILHVHVTKV